jgi:hypothetical protein
MVLSLALTAGETHPHALTCRQIGGGIVAQVFMVYEMND